MTGPAPDGARAFLDPFGPEAMARIGAASDGFDRAETIADALDIDRILAIAREVA